MKIKWTTKKKIILGLIMAVIVCLAGIYFYWDYYQLKEADLILFLGQSNMSGAGGNAKEAQKLIKGAGYECKAITDPEHLVPLTEPFGRDEHKEEFLDDRGLIDRNGSLVTSFVNAYYQTTGERVVAVSASRGSAHIRKFNKDLVQDAQERLETAKQCMTDNEVNIRNIYMVCFIGETDAYLETPEAMYIGEMQKLLNTLQPAGVSKCFLIQTGNVTMGDEKVDTSKIQEAQERLCREDDNFYLVSVLPKELMGKDYTEDNIHFNQKALDMIGEDSGRNAGEYVKQYQEEMK